MNASRLRRLLRGSRPGASPVPKIASRPPVSCLHCGGERFYVAHSTGPCLRILCADPSCRRWFDAAPMLDWLEPVEGDGTIRPEDLSGPLEIR